MVYRRSRSAAAQARPCCCRSRHPCMWRASLPAAARRWWTSAPATLLRCAHIQRPGCQVAADRLACASVFSILHVGAVLKPGLSCPAVQQPVASASKYFARKLDYLKEQLLQLSAVRACGAFLLHGHSSSVKLPEAGPCLAGCEGQAGERAEDHRRASAAHAPGAACAGCCMRHSSGGGRGMMQPHARFDGMLCCLVGRCVVIMVDVHYTAFDCTPVCTLFDHVMFRMS